jgi:drug/metabolite transporter (DMT)-like permease
MCYTLIVGTVALAPVGLPALFAQHWAQVSWRSWLVMAYAVIFPIYISYTIWNWAIALRGVGYVTLYNYLVPILGGVVSFLWLGEQLAVGQFGGAAVVVAGLLVARRGMARRTRRETVAAPAAEAVAEAVGASSETSVAADTLVSSE